MYIAAVIFLLCYVELHYELLFTPSQRDPTWVSGFGCWKRHYPVFLDVYTGSIWKKTCPLGWGLVVEGGMSLLIGLGLNKEIYGATHVQSVRKEARLPSGWSQRTCQCRSWGAWWTPSRRGIPLLQHVSGAGCAVGDKKPGLASELACLVRPPMGKVFWGLQLPDLMTCNWLGCLEKGSP